MKALLCMVLLLVSPALAKQDSNQLMHHWDYDKSAPINIKQAGMQERDGVTIYDISFLSPVGDHSATVGPNGGVVTSYLVAPRGKRPFPPIIHGYRGMAVSAKQNRGEFLDDSSL